MALPSRTTPGLPPAIKPMGIHTSDSGTRRKVVMVNGVPYYQSSGTSNTPGFGRKESGSWWPFSGIEPQGNKWADHLPDNWWAKGPGLGEHPEEGATAHAMDWKTNKPNQVHNILTNRFSEQLDNHDWHEFEDSKQLNDSLIANGWDVPMRGEYPQSQEQPPEGSLQSQGSDFQNGVAMNLAYRMLKARIASPDEEHPEIGRTIFNPDTNEVTDSSVRVMPTKDGRHNNPNNFIRDVIHEDMHTATLPEIDHTNVAQAEYPAFLGEEIYSQRLAEEGKSERPRESYDLERATPHNQALYRISTHPNVPIEDRARAKQAWYDDFVETGEPMNLAWRLLKRQTELGEHHEDFPSSQGPVTGYRAVSNEQREKMIREGMVIKPSAKRPWGHGVWAWMGHNKEGLDDAKFNAEHWADQANYTGKPSSVVGIRGKQDLSHPDSEMHNYNGEYPWKDDEDASHGPYALPNDIPPEQTVRVVNRHPSSASDWAEKWGRQNE